MSGHDLAAHAFVTILISRPVAFIIINIIVIIVISGIFIFVKIDTHCRRNNYFHFINTVTVFTFPVDATYSSFSMNSWTPNNKLIIFIAVSQITNL